MSTEATKAELQMQLRMEELEDLKKVASTAEGRRLLARLFDLTCFFVTIPPAPPETMGFNLGQRNIGCILMNDLLETAPEKYITMQRATKERQQWLARKLREAERNEASTFWEEEER
jgi:hypothetical protein